VRPALGGADRVRLAVAYTLITGAQLATIRALIVVGVMLAAAMLDRPARLADALGIAAIAILLWRPADLFDPAFQLSFAAALVLAVRQGLERRPGVRGPFRVVQWIARGLATSAWVSFATAPITAFHFHQVTIGGVVGNLVLTPILELVALPFALGGLVVDWDLPIAFASTLVGLVDRGAEQLATVSPVGHVTIASPIVVAVLVALTIGLASRIAPRARLLGWVALCIAWSLGRTPPPDGALRVTFVDVGQGDAAILELPNDEVWLVDAGGIAGARDALAASKPGRTISRVLAAYGKSAIDIAIISHPHPDQYAGLLAIDVPIRELWIAPEPEVRRGRSQRSSPRWSHAERASCTHRSDSPGCAPASS
jgi:competence protein ComEC